MKGITKGIVFILLLFLTSFFGSVVFLFPFLPLLCFRLTEKTGKWIMEKFIFMWKLFAVALYEVMIGIKIKVVGEKLLDTHQNLLLIMNHRTRLDWLFLMSYQIRHASLQQYVISLKALLKKIPGPGWAMQCGAFLFLQRKWETDSAWITKCVEYFHRVGHKPQLLFFPEGTDLTKQTKERSDVFAEKNGLQKYSFVLHPRTTGFIHMISQMRKNNVIDGILDVTVAYPKYILQNEGDIIHGRFPEEIHFNINYHNITDIPQNTEKLGEWCQQTWLEKENKLNSYYEKKQFNEKDQELKYDHGALTRYLYMAILFWSFFLIFVFYSLLYVCFFRWYCFIAVVTFMVIQNTIGGVDNLMFS
ncbi:lysocardiolipin acyltransferase 1 [Patella vulgata]|uniref:lysocardiolipin acyltransferase 1 n=1 Tax=Patella vulgata TaxID=6465 RepID=UPI00217FB947|nr:lysocardiolipin acyltransferase 1 [Patella vulgata]